MGLVKSLVACALVLGLAGCGRAGETAQGYAMLPIMTVGMLAASGSDDAQPAHMCKIKPVDDGADRAACFVKLGTEGADAVVGSVGKVRNNHVDVTLKIAGLLMPETAKCLDKNCPVNGTVVPLVRRLVESKWVNTSNGTGSRDKVLSEDKIGNIELTYAAKSQTFKDTLAVTGYVAGEDDSASYRIAYGFYAGHTPLYRKSEAFVTLYTTDTSFDSFTLRVKDGRVVSETK